MVYHEIHSWTLGGLVRTFLDLALAYFLLWVSTFAFFFSKFLNFSGFLLPCPCTGFLGYQNSNLCLCNLLFEWPIRKIYSVLNLVCGRFPFDLVWFRDQEGNLNMKSLIDGRIENKVLELEHGGCSNSSSGLRLQNLVGKESGYDAKGRKIMNQKQKSPFRQRRRASLGYGKSSSALTYDGSEMRSKASSSFGPVSEIEDWLPGDAQTGTDVGERAWRGFQLSGSCGEDDKVEKHLSSHKRFSSNTQEKVEVADNEADRIRLLEKALQEVKAAHGAVFLELEKERAAAATAADEAMAMIVRLQEDKASIEMEARQYQRLIEEKFAYDEEEMSILKEILVRKEKENHLLEKEVEAYRQMNVLRAEDSPPIMLQQIRSGGSFDKKEVDKDASWSSDHDAPSAWKQSYTSLVGKEIASMNHDIDSNLFTSQKLARIYGASSDRSIFSHSEHSMPEKHIVVEGKGDAQVENSILCQRKPVKAVQGGGTEKCLFSVEGLEEIEELRDQPCSKLQSSTVDMEPTIYDVHVIDDQIEHQKEADIRESGLLTSASDERTLLSDLSGDSSFIVRNERLRIDMEIEWLREKLQRVQEQREKLTFSADQKERVNAQLKLMEEIMNKLHELQLQREPVRQVSLPLSSSSKASSNKRCCRSMSDEAHDSA
ncbi:hypothetical protein SLA2020_031380 [Shorea laevis]